MYIFILSIKNDFINIKTDKIMMTKTEKHIQEVYELESKLLNNQKDYYLPDYPWSINLIFLL